MIPTQMLNGDPKDTRSDNVGTTPIRGVSNMIMKDMIQKMTDIQFEEKLQKQQPNEAVK